MAAQGLVGQAVSPVGPLEMFDYRRHLPHWQPEQAVVFLTWRLAGSLPGWRLPQTGVAPQRSSAGRAFLVLDRLSDQATSGPLWLRDPRVARLVSQTLQAGEQQRGWYRLRAWVIMPNHVHVLWQPHCSLARITRWVKGSTARQANLILGRTGQPFWQDESYDHWVRTEVELEKIVRYIERNPVAAGLAAAVEDWPWSSARPTGETACPTQESPPLSREM